MKLLLLVLPAFIVGAKANMNDMRARRLLNKEFLHAMHSNPRISEAQEKNRAQKIRKLNEELIKSSRKLTYSDYQQQAYSDQQAYYSQQQQYQQDGQSGQSQYQQGQAYSDTGTWDGQYWNFGSTEFPFDLSSRAFKYSGCAAIKTYDEERAYETGNPMIIDTYAVFRLCPADKCNKHSINGCGKNYGEYAIQMKTYLSYILGFYDGLYEDYCEYCEPCDYEYQAFEKTTLQECYAFYQQQNYESAQNVQQEAWENYYNSNNGDMSGWNVYNQYYNYQNGASSNYDGNNNGNRRLDQGGYVDENGNWVDVSKGDANYNPDFFNNANYNSASRNQAQSGGYDTANGYWGGDGVWYQYQNGNNGNNDVQYQGMEYLECLDGSICDSCQYFQEQEFLHCDDYTCGDYYTYCSDLYGEAQQGFDISDYLECTEYENNYGFTYYIGPHCGSDHYTISLGVFSDENCLNYIGQDVSLASVLGFQYSDDWLPKECISCDGASNYANNMNSGEGRYGEYVRAPETDTEGVVAVCKALYAGSVQCNMNMNNFQTLSRYMSSYELDLEKRACSFIENINYGAYDESGEILLKADSFDFAQWQNPQQYKKLKMPASQAVFLSLSIIAFMTAAALAILTHRSMTRTAQPWRPKRFTVDKRPRNPPGIPSESGPVGDSPLL